jgi:hypothetical protein
MTQPESSIFRKEAVRHCYGSEQPVLPRFVSIAVFVWLWSLTALLVAGGFAVWSIPMPTRVSGVAVAIDARTLAAFLPARALPYLRIGQSIRLTSLDREIGDGQAFSEPIVRIDSEIVSPETVRRRYGLDPNVAQAITGPTLVAIARCESPAGRVYRVAVASQSLSPFAVFPLIGKPGAKL